MMKGRDHSKDLGASRRIILKWFLLKYFCRMWSEFIWLRIETGGRLL
jgi:hypothetical protein